MPKMIEVARRAVGRPSYRDLFVGRFSGHLTDAELGAVLERCADRLNDVVGVTAKHVLEVEFRSGAKETLEV